MAVAKKIQIYDTTLRDGCQSEDVSLTVEDKLEIAERLDDLGIDYIEGGWPGSNERDAAFFREVKKLKLRHAKIAAFGSTRRAGVRHEDQVAKVSIVGLGMRTHAGVAARMFRVLAGEGINIEMIATSEIKISVVVNAKYGELAMRALHDAFLGESSNAAPAESV